MSIITAKNDYSSWFIPFTFTEIGDDTIIQVAEWKWMLEYCGYYHKDFAQILQVSPSLFSQRYLRTFKPLDVLSRQALLDLLGQENFTEALGRARTRQKRKYMTAQEFRYILKQCRITLERFSDKTPFSDATIARWFTPNGVADVPLRFIDILQEMLKKENFIIAIHHARQKLGANPTPKVDMSAVPRYIPSSQRTGIHKNRPKR